MGCLTVRSIKITGLLFFVLFFITVSAYADFSGINQPGQSSDFTFDVGAEVTSLSLTVTNTTQAYSHLLLKKGSAPTDQDYDFISQFDGRNNSINLELPEVSTGTWYLRVRTPATSTAHTFNVQMTQNVAGMRSSTYPVSKIQAFQSTGDLTSGGWHYYRVEIPVNSPGWRLVLNSSGSGIANLYVRKDYTPTTGTYVRGIAGEANGTVVLTESEATAGAYFIGVYQPSGSSSYQLYSEVGYLNLLDWDPGTTHLGTNVFTNSGQTGGSYYFKIRTQTAAAGVWRTALNVQSGEADLYIRQGSLPSKGSYHTKSERIGSDGFVLRSSQFSSGQDWYIMVQAAPTAQWNLVSGEAYIQDLGQLAADESSSSGEVAIGAEGIRFFKTTTPVDTRAWRLWLNGAPNTIYVKKGSAPVPASYDLSQARQMLVVPNYLDGTGVTYFAAVADNPGTVINLDSRQQAVSDLAFSGSDSLTLSGCGYATYRVQVPVDQIAWQVRVSSSDGDANVAVRRDYVPNEWNNDAYSEVAAPAEDSISLVPSTLSNGTFFITVYGTGPYSYTLTSGNPTITDIPFSSTTVNDAPNLAGWRYYRVADIQSQLGSLGWELLLSNQVAGTEIAIRRNAVPGKWRYRTNGSSYYHTGHVDYSGIGFLQRPGHQADIWYVGVYMPTASLGAFTLTAQPIPATPTAFDGSSTDIVDQPSGSWRYFRVDVPVNAVGWDIRLTNVTSGFPRLVVRRDQLPNALVTDNGAGTSWRNMYPTYSDPWNSTAWPSGWQWAAGYDWSGRYYDSSGSIYEYGRILAMGMGNPLEPGTYYVGVINSSGTSSMSYTLLSRGIGDGMSIPLVDLPFDGGSATASDVAPRDVVYYRVNIPENTPSWQMRLTPTVGEAMLQLQWQKAPTMTDSGNGSGLNGSPFYGGGKKMQKTGKEQWVLLPNSGSDYISAGTYYIAAVSEGQNPSADNRIGTGTSDWTIESLCVIDINNLGSVGETDLVQADTLDGGAVKAYQFTVPEGTMSMEVRLENRTGFPMLKVVQGSRLPSVRYTYPDNGYPYDYYGNYGGQYPPFYGTDLITVPNPTAGTYSVIVNASNAFSSTGAGLDANYTLRVTAVGVAQTAFDGGISDVTGQASGTWRFFRVDVPANAVGWDIRLTNVTSGLPRLVVRRDQLPNALTTNDGSSDRSEWTHNKYPADFTTWPSGYQWTAGNDWTNRTYDSSGTINETGRILAMGMGNPLEPGTYYVGVTNSSGTSAMSYALLSRGIGDGMSIPLVDLPFDGGSSTASDVTPRDAVYYRVTVPENTHSWQLRLNPTDGEAMMKLQLLKAPNISVAYYGNSSPYQYGGINVQKTGLEQWVLLPESGSDFISAGTYYIAAISEGHTNNNNIGTGASDWTMESLGTVDINNLGTVGETDLVQADTLEGGAVKAYQFTVPEGTLSLEIRLEDRVGNPMLKVVQGTRLPSIRYYNGGTRDYYGSHGGQYPPSWHTNLITVANPAPGIYSVAVNASDGGSYPTGAGPDANYTLRVTAVGMTQTAFDGGSSTVTGQASGTWKFFKVDVPANAVGWDLRLVNVTSGSPRFVVRRDQLPNRLATDNGSEYGYWRYPYSSSTWPSGYQWAAESDWTYRNCDASGSVYEYGRVLAMGMGNPLEPGTYYVGVTDYLSTTSMSYTLLSRGIGDDMAIPLVDLAFDGGNATATGVAPRDVVYYRVTIPENTPSWQIRLTPTVGEALMQLQWQKAPTINGTNLNGSPFSGGGKRMKKTAKEQWVLLPDSGSDFISAGTYYIVAVSEGQSPSADNNVGTGTSDWTIESLGAVDINNLGTVGGTDLVQADTLEGGAVKAYQFTVPEGTQSLEVRLEDKAGNPMLKVVQGSRLPAVRYHNDSSYRDYYGNYGGQYPPSWHTDLITVPNPTPGAYSVVVNASNGINTTGVGPDASYTLHVRKHVIQDLNFTASQSGNGLSNTISGQLADQQSEFFKVVVPSEVDGGPVVGWRLNLSMTQGVASVRARKGSLPDSSAATMPYKTGAVLMTPPYLTPGVWYVEVKGSGNTIFTLTSLNYQPQRPVWTMPPEGEPVTTPGLQGTPYFADTGIDTDGNPLPGDQGIDLENGLYHYYAVEVPSNNAVLIRTMLEAISGNPDLYIRSVFPPTTDHNTTGQPGELVDRRLIGTGTEYGNWVPLDGKLESYLTGGIWHFAVRAAGSTNCRYRLRISAGDVQTLDLNGGSYTGQIVAAKDWRYYKVSIPWDAPANWHVTFSQQSGDVVMYVRDTSPPGNSTYGTNYVDWGSIYPYSIDNKNNGPYSNYDPAGAYTFNVPVIRPGHTYYLGFRANNDASFSVSSSTSGGVFANPVVVLFYGGSTSTTIPANSSKVFRFDVPADAGSWVLNNTHTSSVSVYMEQGTMPTATMHDWGAVGFTNSSFSRSFVTSTSWPWLPGFSYYMVATNTSAMDQLFSTTSTGTAYSADLGLTMADSPDPLTMNMNITYTMTLSNKVNLAAKNVVVTDYLPAGMSLVSATSTVGTCSGTNPVVCNIGTLNPGATATITIVAKANAGGVLTNTATVVSSMPEVNSDDNTVSASTTVVSWPGSGSPEDPYLVATPEELHCVRYQMDKCFRQIADIDLGISPWSDGAGWQPIGFYTNSSSSNPFTGAYDGNGYSITDLTINRPTTDSVGLFGYADGAELVNIDLSQINVVGRQYTGGLVGRQNGGTITSCQADGSITGTSYVGGLVGYTLSSAAVSDSRATVTCQASSYVGGLIGYNNYSSIVRSWSAGGVSITNSYAGGLVGYNNYSTITDCYTTAFVSSVNNFSGGLVGYNYCSNITNAYSNGTVIGSGSNLGGLIGQNAGGTITQSYWDKTTSGRTTSAGGMGKTTDEMKQQATFVNWDFSDIWEIQEGVTYPYFRTPQVFEPVGVFDARLSANDRPVQIDGAIVSAAWNNSFYIESDDRNCGLRIEKTVHGITDNNARATVKGIVKTSSGGERYIQASFAAPAGSGSVEPVGLPLKSLGGRDFLHPVSGVGQQGVVDGNGLNNIGLLVRVWGRVVEVEPTVAPAQPTWFTIDDGSGRTVKCVIVDGGSAIDPLWQGRYVVVTGISSCELNAGGLVPIVRVKRNVDPIVY